MNKNVLDMNHKRNYNAKKMNETLRRLAVALLLLFGWQAAMAQTGWTDPGTNVTFTPISGTTGLSGEDWGNGCDGDIYTKHGGNGSGPWYMVLKASEPVKLYGYTITTANDNATYHGRNPHSWVVEGSNDGSTWTVIHSVTNDATLEDVNYTEYGFLCSTTTLYTYFRFYVTANNGGNYMQYSEFHPYGAIEGTSEGGESSYTTGTYVIYNGSNYLNGTTAGTATFAPGTCIWTGTDGGTWHNDANNYLRNNTGTFYADAASNQASNWTLFDTESGTTGQKLRSTYTSGNWWNQTTNYSYIRYNSGWTLSTNQNNNTAANNGTSAVFAVTKYTYTAEYVNPAISGASTINTNGASRYLMTVIPTRKAGYVDYVFYNGAHHYFESNGTTARANEPAAENYDSYTWTLTGIGNTYAEIDQHGIVTYKQSVATATNATVTLTYHFPSGNTMTANKAVTFQPMANPTALTMLDNSLTICKDVNDTAMEATYTITPANAYHNITVTSSDNSVATGTIGTRGVLSISAKSIGTATLTLTAKNTDGTNGPTATIDITVSAAAATPTITFNNATNEVTIASSTGTIYYTTDGTEPSNSNFMGTGTTSVTFGQTTACRVRAVAVTAAGCTSQEATYNLVKLATPYVSFAVAGGTATATFESTDDGVTFYYNSYDIDGGAADPGVPTTSSSSWTPGNANPTFTENHLVHVITMKAATSTTGYITSDMYKRRANSTDMSDRSFVFFYKDAGGNVNFMANSSGTITNTTTFNPSNVVWDGHIYANDSEEARTLLGGQLYYEPFIYYSNNGQYLKFFTGCDDYGQTGWESGKLRLTHNIDEATSVYFFPRTIAGRGELINVMHFDDNCYSQPLTFHLGYNTSSNQWSRLGSMGVAIYSNDFFAVVYPVEQLGGGGFTLTSDCPDDGAGGLVSLNKGQSITINASVSGTYNPVYYHVGNGVAGTDFYYYPGSSTPMTAEPTGYNDIRLTYELVNAQGYVELAGNTATLLYDPGRDLLVTVRIIATPYDDLGNPINEGILTSECQFHVLTAPPFPAPVISRVEGTNQYQMTCSAAGSTIEYRVGDETEWHTYSSPITVVTPGTVIMARSKRGVSEMSDPVTYVVGGASLLPPTISVGDDGVVTLSANGSNSGLDGYTGESWLYTLDGSDPDPDNVGSSNPTQIFSSVTLTNGQSIKVIAIDENIPALFGHSAVVVAHYKVNSGADANNSGIITLNDYEDHEWSYYQASADLPAGYPAALHSPYPRNVKITYYGYGENTLSTSAVAAPAANTFNINTTQGDVKVGIDEPGHTFIYYKTLERNANGRYPYELIPNPFYVRPDVRTYTGDKTVTFTLNDEGGDGWGASYLQIDYSTSVNGHSTENIEFTESRASKTVTKTIPTGVTFVLTWHAGGGQSDECSFIVSGYDNQSSTYSSGTGLSSGPLTAIKVHGTETVTTYTGFYKWRILSISGGKIYNVASGGTALAVGAMLDAETTYYFDPNDNAETNVHNATSMEIELEALWAPAQVITSGTTFSSGYNSVERNFYVGRSGQNNDVFYTSTPCTYSSFYPNGTTNGTTMATLANRNQIRANTASADSKVEYYIWGSTNTLNTGGYRVTVGRGVTSNSNPNVTPLSGTFNSARNACLRLESGTYGNGTTTQNLYGTPTVNANLVHLDLILGSDYDRAKGDNTKLSFAPNQTIAHGAHTANNASWLSFQHLDIVAKSGKIQSGYFTDASASYNRTFYCRSTLDQNGRYPGISYLTIEGGEFASVNGGRGNYQDNVALDDDIVFSLRMKGGIIHGSIYGAASANPSHGGRRVVITGGTVEGWIAGGCDGTSSGGGATIGDAFFYIGGNGIVGTTTRAALDGTEAGNIFGAGRGMSNHGTSAQPASMRNAFIAVADNGFVLRNVYGGGDYGYTGVTQSNGTISDQTAANFYILGGTVNGAVHGGGNNNNSACSNANIIMTGGLVKGGIYGGSNNSGTMAYNVNIQVDGGQVGTDADHTANVHGGGYGQATVVTGNVDVTIGSAAGAPTYATIYGDVYGGSALGKVNGTAVSNTKHTNVTLNAGKIHGSLYGGALGSNSVEANVYAPVHVVVNGGGVHSTTNMGSGAVYGCNNIKGAPQSTVEVDIYGTDDAADGYTYALDAVYGGGNQASYDGTPVVEIHNCDNKIEYVYGGGNAADVMGTDLTIWGGDSIGYVFGGGNGSVSPANVTGDVDLNIYGGTILHVFGGNNTSGSIDGAIDINVNKQADTDPNSDGVACDMKIGELYGGGNMADGNAGTITVGCTGDYVAEYANNHIGEQLEGIAYLYGGANKADVDNNITLNINGGIVKNAFGGNNNSGNINGTITVNVNKTNNSCDWYVGNVYGGGNQADYTATGSHNYPAVNILAGTVSENVYGGGFGDMVDPTKGLVEGNPQVIVNGATAVVDGSVFGGGSMAGVTGNPQVSLVTGNVKTGLYGGCNASGTIDGDVTVSATGGTIGTDASHTANVHGGGYGAATATTGDVDVTVDGSTVWGDIYGGSGFGNVNDALADATTVTLASGTVHGDIYGGGLGDADNEALVNGTVHVTVTGGSVVERSSGVGGRVFGCNNVNGTPKGSVNVTINGTAATTTDGGGNKIYALQGVYGGGNLAAYLPTNDMTATLVTVNGCGSSIKDLYGGGNAAPVPATHVTIHGGDIDRAFAGGNGESGTPAHVGFHSTSLTPSDGDSYGTGVANLIITDGTINKVFGGSNSNGDIRTSANVSVDRGSTSCGLHIGELYGGGNLAAGKAGSISIGCTGGDTEGIGDLYGGANAADVTGNITLNIHGGSIERAFGGNNTSGSIDGNITVNVNWDSPSSCGYNHLGSVFGGGNQAAYGGPSDNKGNYPQVNVLNGTVTNHVFGGGLGATAIVYGNPQVTIGDNTNGHTATVSGDVYGGGDAAAVQGTPVVHVINKCNTTIYNVYGGGNAADVSATNVTIDGGNITGMVFGGGHGDKNANPQKAANVNGDVNVTVTGGTINKVFGGSNSKGNISGDITLNVAKGNNSCEMHVSEVYGGGNEAAGNAGTITIGCTGSASEGIGDVYGGANAADINSDITLNITGGKIGRVFGGNNTSGAISGNIIVNVEWSGSCAVNSLGSVFGGGNQAAYGGPSDNKGNYPQVNIKNGTVTNNVYGGGLGGTAIVYGNPQVTIGDANASHVAIVNGDVYGGGDAAAVTGNTQVTYNDNNASSAVANLFGGGNAAGISGTATVDITSGKVTTGVYGGCNSEGDVAGNITVNINGGALGVSGTPMTSGIFGGGFGSSTTTGGNVTVNIGSADGTYTPTVYGDIYGGSALGAVNDATADLTTVNVNNGTIHGNVYGGGLGAATLNGNGYIASVTTEAVVNGTVHVNIGTSGQSSNSVTIDGQVFGCNNLAGSPKGNVFVDVYHTAHVPANTYPNPEPTTTDEVGALASSAFAIDAVYGGGNLAHYTTTLADATTNVHIHNCDNTIQYVYGGGNAANSPATNVVIDGGRFNYVFGGGNGAGTGNPGANIVGDATVTVNGGIIYRAFGGSNTRGTIGGTSSIGLPETTTCTRLVHEVFGGGNEAAGGSVNMTIPCGSTGVGTIYAGANNADMGSEADFNAGNPVTIQLNIEGGDFDEVFCGNNQGGTIWGNVKLNLNGGTIGSAFGGSNAGGNIIGDILVRVNDSVPECPLTVQTVYGGGNIVPYEPDGPSTLSAERFSPRVELINGTVSGDVFGGGLGAAAVIWGNPQVIVGSDGTNPSTSEKHTFTVLGNIYGGGSASPVKGSTLVKLTSSPDHDVTIGTSADAEGAFGGYPTEHGSIFGGGLGATAIVGGNTSVGIFGNRTTVYHNVYGGGSAGKVLGSTDVQVSADAAFTMALPNIAIAPDGKVSIASTTPGASFRYNIGATPADPTTESGTLYSAPFQATAGQFIKAIAFREDYTPSGIATTAAVPIPVPTISSDGTTATATANTTYGPADQTLYYTLDGTAPDPATATTYTTGVAVASGQVFKVVATKDDYTQSVPAFNTVATPEVTIAGGNATITCATPGATIRYVLGAEDGENPGQYLEPAAPTAWTTTGSTTYSAPVPIAEGQTIKVIADLPGYEPSHLASKTR